MAENINVIVKAESEVVMITKREAAIISAYTGILFGEFSEMHKYIEQIMGRPVFIHEFASKDITNEIKQKSKKDFCSLTIGI